MSAPSGWCAGAAAGRRSPPGPVRANPRHPPGRTPRHHSVHSPRPVTQPEPAGGGTPPLSRVNCRLPRGALLPPVSDSVSSLRRRARFRPWTGQASGTHRPRRVGEPASGGPACEPPSHPRLGSQPTGYLLCRRTVRQNRHEPGRSSIVSTNVCDSESPGGRCAWQESNLRPRAPEARALSPELQARSGRSVSAWRSRLGSRRFVWRRRS